MDTNKEQNSVKPHHHLNAGKPSQDADTGILQKQLRAFNTSNASGHCKMCSRKLSWVIFRWQFLHNFLSFIQTIWDCVEMLMYIGGHETIDVCGSENNAMTRLAPGPRGTRTPNPALWKN